MRRFATFVLAVLLAVPVVASTYVVNDAGDGVDATLGDDICSTGTVCTLRAAIMEANAHAGTDSITFSIAGTIAPAAPLPLIVDRVDIDATTAPGYTTAPVVNLDGQATLPYGLNFFTGSASSTLTGMQVYGCLLGGVRIEADNITLRRNYIGPVTAGTANAIGIEIVGNACTIGGANGQGNVISGNQGDGISVIGSGASIRDNFIGTNAAATAALGNAGDGINVTAASATIGSSVANEWNVISGNGGAGVDIESGSGNTIAGNFIGTDITGTSAIANNLGIRAMAAGNTVGTTAARNLVSGNSSEGILVANTSNTIVRNNYAGTDITGSVGIGNGAEGIRITSSSNIDVGGTAAGEGNLASFNGSDGISIGEANDVRIYGNIAGLNAAGDSILGNGFAGIAISAGTNILVGSLTGTGRNIVSGNSFGGIFSGFGTGNIIEGNRVGTNAAGTAAMGNLDTGIEISSDSGTIVRSNLVSGNDGHGIEMTNGAANTVVHSNVIGLSADLSTAIPNSGDGINVCDSASGTTVGTIVLGGNTIANNGANGIGIEPTALLDNNWSANSIYSNTGLGIDLNRDGVTANDALPGDADTGPNNLQNFPTIVAAVTSATSSQTRGTFNSTPNSNFTIFVYSSPTADPSGNGEGQKFLGATSVVTDGNGDGTWILNGTASTPGHVATATAQGADGGSEFSGTFTVATAPTVQFSAANYSVAENGVLATITVTRTGDLSAFSSVQYTTLLSGTASSADFIIVTGPVSFDPGESSKTFTVPIIDDALDETNETINLVLSNPTAATLGAQSTAVLTIIDDDPTPSLIINDRTLAEGNSGTTNFVFTVSLSAVSGQQVQVNYTTNNGTAIAGSDYTTTSGTATITAGNPSTTITVPVLGDTAFEPNETFTVDLSAPVNATINDGQGLGTITNEDLPNSNLGVTKTANVPTFTPGQQITFTITVSNAGPDAATATTVTDVLPAGTTFVSATPSQGSCSGTTTVTCSLGTLNNGANATITLVVTATGSSNITNTATASSASNDPASGNNSGSATVTVNTAAIPTVSMWFLLLLGAALVALALRRM